MLEPDGRPAGLAWDYTRAEIIADGVIHALGVTLGLVGAIAILAVALTSSHVMLVIAALIYACGLLAVLSFSAAYNMWPVSRRKWILRRFDHSAIYLLIAATYTPFLLQVKGEGSWLLVGIWVVALAGMAVKLTLPGRLDRLSIGLYLLMGWSGVIAYDVFVKELTPGTLALLAAGGLLYTVGVIFHAWRGLRFQNAVWHAFVLMAAICHYIAVLNTVAFAA
jgi:hemolysin III